MTPLHSPALPALPPSPPAASGSGKQAPDAADGRDFASALERSRQAAPEDDASPAAADAAASPRAGKAPGAKRNAEADGPTLQAPLAEVLLAAAPAAPMPSLPAASGLQAAGALAASRQTAATAAALPASAALAPTAQMEEAAAHAASADAADAHLPKLPDLLQAGAAGAPGAAQTPGPASSRKLARDAAPLAAATAPATPGAMRQPGAVQPGDGESVAAPAVDPVAPRAEARPHPTPDRTANLATDPRRDTGIGSTAAIAAAVTAAGNMQPAPFAAPRLQDPSAQDDVSTAPPAIPAGVAVTPTAAGAPAQGPAATPAAIVPVVGSDAWGAALGHQLVRLGRGGGQVAELNLNPAHLGPLKITLSVTDNQAQVAFVSAHASVRDAVEAALPQLRASLADTGISLGQTSVGAESRQGAQRDPSPAPDRDSRPVLAADAASAGAAFTQPSRTTASTSLRTPGLGVDTFA
jgi:flagellar hook-length control protein FliK